MSLRLEACSDRVPEPKILIFDSDLDRLTVFAQIAKIRLLRGFDVRADAVARALAWRVFRRHGAGDQVRGVNVVDALDFPCWRRRGRTPGFFCRRPVGRANEPSSNILKALLFLLRVHFREDAVMTPFRSNLSPQCANSGKPFPSVSREISRGVAVRVSKSPCNAVSRSAGLFSTFGASPIFLVLKKRS